MLVDRHIRGRRYREILAVFTKYGFGFLFEQFGIYNRLKIRVSNTDATFDSTRTSAGKRLKLALEELGPAFVKIGQILSTRPDLLPPDIVEELRMLQDSVQSFPYADVRTLIKNEFEDNLENIYPEFDEEPIAAASIAQVHRARLISGKQVAVKVQRPEIEKNIDLDLDILKNLAHFIDHHTKYGEFYDCSGMVADFENIIKNELDFTKEAENADTFKRNFYQDEGITVPNVRWIYTTKRVLTMEYMKGTRISEYDTLDKLGIDRSKLAEKLAASMCNQILRDGFFHADPHPGNIHVMPDGTIIFLDLGMVGRLNESRKRMISNFFIGVASQDSRMVVKSLIDLENMPKRSNIKKFEQGVSLLIEKYLTRPMKEIKVEELFYEIFHLAFVNHIKIPREFALLAKTLGTLQGLLEKLAPDLNALVVAKPIAKKLLRQSLSAERISKEMKKSLLNYRDLFSEFPVAMLNFLGKMEEEDFTVQFQLKEIDKLQQRFERVFNRIFFSMVLLAVSIIIAGVIIGSGLSADAGSEIYHFNISVLKIGLAMAAIIVLGLMISMFRSGR